MNETKDSPFNYIDALNRKGDIVIIHYVVTSECQEFQEHATLDIIICHHDILRHRLKTSDRIRSLVIL